MYAGWRTRKPYTLENDEIFDPKKIIVLQPGTVEWGMDTGFIA